MQLQTPFYPRQRNGRFLLVLLGLLLISYGQSTTASTVNLIDDGTFESNLGGFYVPYNDATVALTANYPIRGSQSLSGSLTSWGNIYRDVLFQWNQGPFASSVTATATFRVESAPQESNVTVCVLAYYQDNDSGVQQCTPVDTIGSTTDLSVSASLDAARRLNRIYFHILLPAVGNATFVMDDANLVLNVVASDGGDGDGNDNDNGQPDTPDVDPPVDDPSNGDDPPDVDRPEYPTSNLTPQEGARFLAQATFGPTQASIVELLEIGNYNDWITQQFAAPIGLQLPYVQQRYLAESRARNRTEEEIALYFNVNSSTGARHDAWWRNILTGEDQLRQRVAFAFSEILVVSDVDLALRVSQFGMADYHDTLARLAFSNYRELLEAITLHPVMGKFLSALRNQKSDPDANTRPDENFAREVLQLFSLGVNRLNIDGSPQTDSTGRSVPAYDQKNIIEYAKVFTGWNYANISWNLWDGYGNMVDPMVPVEQYHEPGAKRLIDGSVANSDARGDLKAALDSIFNHPNVGPFLARQLIQRLVTSNPSPPYIARIARVFNNNGQGVRGDLAAVIRAILLDPEAREGHINQATTFGKLREPLLRITHTWRAFSATQTPGTAYGLLTDDVSYKTPFDGGIYNMERIIEQAPLRAPSVFNFFLPDYSPSGVMREAGLFGPEFQLATESATIGITNLVNSHIQEDWTSGNQWTALDLSLEASLVADSQKLLDHLDIILLAGAMTDGLSSTLVEYLNTPATTTITPLAKARDIVTLIVNSPEYLIQK